MMGRFNFTVRCKLPCLATITVRRRHLINVGLKAEMHEAEYISTWEASKSMFTARSQRLVSHRLASTSTLTSQKLNQNSLPKSIAHEPHVWMVVTGSREHTFVIKRATSKKGIWDRKEIVQISCVYHKWDGAILINVPQATHSELISLLTNCTSELGST